MAKNKHGKGTPDPDDPPKATASRLNANAPAYPTPVRSGLPTLSKPDKIKIKKPKRIKEYSLGRSDVKKLPLRHLASQVDEQGDIVMSAQPDHDLEAARDAVIQPSPEEQLKLDNKRRKLSDFGHKLDNLSSRLDNSTADLRAALLDQETRSKAGNALNNKRVTALQSDLGEVKGLVLTMNKDFKSQMGSMLNLLKQIPKEAPSKVVQQRDPLPLPPAAAQVEAPTSIQEITPAEDQPHGLQSGGNPISTSKPTAWANRSLPAHTRMTSDHTTSGNNASHKVGYAEPELPLQSRESGEVVSRHSDDDHSSALFLNSTVEGEDGAAALGRREAATRRFTKASHTEHQHALPPLTENSIDWHNYVDHHSQPVDELKEVIADLELALSLCLGHGPIYQANCKAYIARAKRATALLNQLRVQQDVALAHFQGYTIRCTIEAERLARIVESNQRAAAEQRRTLEAHNLGKAAQAQLVHDREQERTLQAVAAQSAGETGRGHNVGRDTALKKQDLLRQLAELDCEDNERDQVGNPLHDHMRAHSPTRSSGRRDTVKVPQPQAYSGDPHDDVDEILFSFQNYLEGNKIPKPRWTVHAMQLLKGKALAAYIAFAQPLQKQGIIPTWDQFVTVLQTAFITHDRQLEARNALFNTVQLGSVTNYLQSFRVLISRAGSPAPCDKDLLLHYWKGLKQSIKDDSKIDPTTGSFWTFFEDLARLTITISRNTDLAPHHGATPKRRSWLKPDRLKLKTTQLKYRSHQDTHSHGSGKSGGRGGGGSSSGGGRGGRGGCLLYTSPSPRDRTRSRMPSSA